MHPIGKHPPAFEPGELSYLIVAEYVPGTYRNASGTVRKMLDGVLGGFPAKHRVERVRDMAAWSITEMLESPFADGVVELGGTVRIVWTHGGDTAGATFHR